MNLINIFAALSDKTPEEVVSEFSGKDFSYFKPKLAELTVEKIEPISLKMKDYLNDKNYIDNILDVGSSRAAKIANPIVDQVYDIFGLIRKKRY